MRGKNPEYTPRFASWFAICTMTVVLGFVLNTVGACGPPTTNEGTTTDGGVTDTTTTTETPATETTGCKADKDCKTGETCDTNTGKCNPKATGCKEDKDCKTGETCDTNTGKCNPKAGCKEDKDCKTGETCDTKTGKCNPATTGCKADKDCKTGETCDTKTGKCNPATTGCKADKDCKTGETCDTKTGKCSTKPPVKGSGEITDAKASATNTRAPLDASPSPDGKTVYYTAYKAAAAVTKPERSNDADGAKNKDPFGQNNDRQEGVLYSVPAAGGTSKELAGGFWSPTGLVVSKDGSKIYVADSNVSDTLKPDTVGAIYSVNSAGGAKTVVSGTEGYKPKSLDIVTETGDVIYFTGVDPKSDKPGVFSITAAGGTVSTVYTPGATDEFFKDPGGIAVAAGNVIYVAETIGGMGGNSSSIIQIKAGKATEFAMGIKVGYPAGIALSHDEKFLLVSGIDRNKSNALVYRIDLSDPKKITQIGKGISIESKTNSAGLHRAHNADIFAWADAAWPDADGKNGGTVFLLNTKANP